MSKPKVLFFDIETAPMLVYAWGLFDQNIGLNQIKEDWYVLSWAAKWLGEKKMMYQDQSRVKPRNNDKALLLAMWELLDEADVVVTQNGKRFDVKKLNARFLFHGIAPPSPFRHIDTLEIAKRHFALSSNKLEYMAKMLDTETKKMTRRKFDGFDLWKECLAGNRAAWKEMKKYNKKDVDALAQVYEKMIVWDSSVNFNVYTPGKPTKCKCGSTEFKKRGFYFTNLAKYQVYRCAQCGAQTRDRINLLDKDARGKLRPGA